MSVSTFLPSTLPLLPLPPPQVLYPHLSASVALPASHLALVLNSIAENTKSQKVEGTSRIVAVVPVVEIERRVGRWACAARIKRIEKSPKLDDTYHLVLEGLARIRLPRSLPPVLSILPPIPLTISTFSIPLPVASSLSIDLLPLAMQVLPPQLHEKLQLLSPSLLADVLVTVVNIDWERRVELLALPDIEDRSKRVRDLLSQHLTSKNGGSTTIAVAKPKVSSSGSRALMPRPNTVSSQATGQQPLSEDLQPLQEQLVRRKPELTKAAQQAVERELKRLSRIPAQSAEYGVSRTYVEWLLALPWKKVDEIDDKLDLTTARKLLDDEHEGLEAVKRRVVEYLAVYRLKRQLFIEGMAKREAEKKNVDLERPDEQMDTTKRSQLESTTSSISQAPETAEEAVSDNMYRDKGPILLLCGPPGVGKTSIARSLAKSMGRKFHRISLGGVRDEAEIRGHRRTYVGALPGNLVQALRKVGTSNPLILLDELDKVGASNFHGDPSSALLETLDPAQNWSFHDHYLGDVPIDLSQVLFVATANTTDTISAPLLDRCEVIECSGYVVDEKLAIAKRFLLPKQITENGLTSSQVEIRDDALLKVVTDYTREAGVRSLEREIGKLCRRKAVEWSTEREKDNGSAYRPTLSSDDVERILGIAKFDEEIKETEHRPGVVTGMAYRGSGSGGILLIETTLVPGGNGKFTTTGSLGDVISESADLALTWVRSRAMALGLTSSTSEDPLKNVNLHLHLPAGAVKKDGPSAGLAMVLAFVSLLTGRSMPSHVAVTGEITLRGAVTAVGGIKEKVIGAHRAGITKIIMPMRNMKDVEADLPLSIRESVIFSFISTIDEALEDIWGKGIWSSTPILRVEARL